MNLLTRKIRIDRNGFTFTYVTRRREKELLPFRSEVGENQALKVGRVD